MSNQWQKLAMDMTSSADGGSIGFVKDTKTVLKIVAPPNAKEEFNTDWFMEWYQKYPGSDKATRKFMIYAVDVQSQEKKVQPWVIGASVMTQIISLVSDNDYDVLSPDNGTPVSITKQGSGMNTRYNVQAAPKVFDSSKYNTDSCMSLSEAVAQLTKPKDSKPANNADTEIDW
jgi:hypothetical protein